MSRLAAFALLSVAGSVFTNCEGGWVRPTESPADIMEMTKTEVITGLEDESRSTF